MADTEKSGPVAAEQQPIHTEQSTTQTSTTNTIAEQKTHTPEVSHTPANATENTVAEKVHSDSASISSSNSKKHQDEVTRMSTLETVETESNVNYPKGFQLASITFALCISVLLMALDSESTSTSSNLSRT